jgi:hypothetical protein
MTRLGDLEAKVKIEDTYATEYEDDDDEAEESESVTTKYIEAVSGAGFGITCRVLPIYRFNEDFLSFQIFVDGERAGGMHFFSSKHDHQRGQATLLHHASVGWNNDRKRLRYRFADLRTRKLMVLCLCHGLFTRGSSTGGAFSSLTAYDVQLLM